MGRITIRVKENKVKGKRNLKVGKGDSEGEGGMQQHVISVSINLKV